MNKKTTVITIACLILISIGLHRLFVSTENNKNWEISVFGASRIQPTQITRVIQFLIESNEESQISGDLVENTLKLNPLISSVKVTIGPGKGIKVELTENQTAVLIQKSGEKQLSEYSLEGYQLRENLSELDQDFSSSIPILYLTEDVKNSDSFSSTLGDITQLWATTQQDYHFLWDRISEVKLVSTDPLEYHLYISNHRTMVISRIPWSPGLLARFWALVYYLDQNPAKNWQRVELTRSGATIKESRLTN